MHIQENIHPVSLAQVKNTLHIIKILIIIFVRLGLNHAPSRSETDNIKTPLGHLSEKIVIDFESELIILTVLALVYDIDTVKYTLTAVSVNKALLLGNYSLHDVLLLLYNIFAGRGSFTVYTFFIL